MPATRDLMTVVDRLTVLQLDPRRGRARADLVAWGRIGTSYAPDHLRDALERDRAIVEHGAREVGGAGGRVGTSDDGPPALPRRHGRLAARVREHDEWLAPKGLLRRVLDQLRAEGPLFSRDIPDTAGAPWPSTGWTNNRNVTLMLEFLERSRRGRHLRTHRSAAPVWTGRAGLPG